MNTPIADAPLVLEYLKVFLTGPVIGGAVALTSMLLFRRELKGLITRIATLRFPGGEISAPQLPSPPSSTTELPEVPESDLPRLPASVPGNTQLQEQLNAERARAYLWEYRYLNLFLAAVSQRVLEWFATLEARPSYPMYDTYWTSMIPDPSQRRTILSVLEAHHLVQREGELYGITPKGREYLEWRTRI